MSPAPFAAALRALAAASTRRAALTGLFAAVAAATADVDTARSLGSKSRRSRNTKNRKRKKQNRKRNKNNSSSSKGCTVRHSEQEILGFIRKAAKKYGQSENVMIRVARCESSLNPCALNRSGPYYGLFQYLKSTWKTTPYGHKNIYDPKAQAMATGWMWKQGRKNEWACQ